MASLDKDLRELCLEVALGNVGGTRFNDLLIKTGIQLEGHEWVVATRLLEKTEEVDHLAAVTTASLH